MERPISLEVLLKKFIESNDQFAFRQIFERLYPSLENLAFNFTHNKSLSEDIVMEIFEKFWRNRLKHHGIKNLHAYLYTSVRNHAIDHMKRKKDLININIDPSEVKEYFTKRSPEKILLEEELFELVNKAIEELPQKSRMVYRMLKEEGLKYREVAELLDISPKTVDYHIHLAMQKIRNQIRIYLEENSGRSNLSVIKLAFMFFCI
ncbi:MAG: RNA polymerase sigma-70 factor [Cytophagales bacterium]|nr:RNA polymerase sigma-70 factor [Cytophagales bacterium]